MAWKYFCVSRARPRKSQVAIGSLEGVCDLVVVLMPIKGVLISEPIFIVTI